MEPKRFPKYVLLTFLVIALPGMLQAEEPPAGTKDVPPNIVLLMADDQGWGDVAYNVDSPLKTPVLDDMAAKGLRFDRFYAAAPVCSPTRGSVLTGRHPNRFGCFSWGYTLRPEEVTVAEALSDAGYTTGHFGKWHLGEMDATSPVSPGKSGFKEWVSSPNFFENSPLLSHNGKVIETEGEGSQVTVDAAVSFIRDAVKAKSPFLAVVWFGSPHLPHVPLESDRAQYAEHPVALQNYWAEITAMDRAIGKLREELKTLGIADNTLVWYTSDNGATTPGSTGGLRGKKGSLYEGGIRVPGIVEWPARIKSPRKTDLPAGSVDIFPTLLDLVGVQPPKDRPLDGTSLRPLFDGQMDRRTKPLGFWVYPAPGRPVRSNDLLKALAAKQAGDKKAADPTAPPPGPAADRQSYPETDLPGHSAWIDGDWKLHRIPFQSGEVTYTLYDLKQDATESHNLIAQQADRVATMKKDLEAWQLSVVRSLNGHDYQSENAQQK